MAYKEGAESRDDDGALGLSADLPLGNDELSFEETADESDDSDENELTEAALENALLNSEEISSKKKVPPKTFSLQARRAIEDHLEKRRLRQELDYLFDDELNNPVDPKE